MSSARRRVVVTGLGVVAPNGVGLPAYREALRAGRSGIRRHPELGELKFACQIGGIPPIEEEEVLKILPLAEFEKFNEAMVYAALASLECARNAGVPVDLSGGLPDGPPDWKTGAVIGCGIGGMDTLFNEMTPVIEAAARAETGRGMTPMGTEIVPKIMESGVSVAVGRLLGLGGQVTTNSSACTTGTEAIFEAYKNILLGYCDAAYAGGAEGSHYAIWAGFDAMRDVLCSQYNELPERGSQPMAAGACGFVPSSGAGVLRLEALDAALARGAPILAELASAYCNSGGQRNGGTMTFPNPDGVVRCIRRALADADVVPDEVSLINGHLTSTKADPLEIREWREALGLAPERFPTVQATKSMIGHALGAAGGLEAVAVVDQISRGYVHPSINCENVHPEILPVAASIPREARDQKLEVAVKASFGFGDVNGCLVFKRWDSASS